MQPLHGMSTQVRPVVLQPALVPGCSVCMCHVRPAVCACTSFPLKLRVSACSSMTAAHACKVPLLCPAPGIKGSGTWHPPHHTRHSVTWHVVGNSPFLSAQQSTFLGQPGRPLCDAQVRARTASPVALPARTGPDACVSDQQHTAHCSTNTSNVTQACNPHRMTTCSARLVAVLPMAATSKTRPMRMPAYQSVSRCKAGNTFQHNTQALVNQM